MDKKNSRCLIGAMGTLSLVMLAYWILWFTDRSAVASAHSSVYVAFENSFPLADGLLTFTMLASIVALRRQSSYALLWLLLGSGGAFYLFGMDVLYDLEHRVWFSGTNGLVELGINALTLFAAIGIGRWAWTRRHELDPVKDTA